MSRVGEDEETRVLKIIQGLRRSKKHLATQLYLTERTGLDVRTVRQILRRLRRKGKVKVTFAEDQGKRKIRVYS